MATSKKGASKKAASKKSAPKKAVKKAAPKKAASKKAAPSKSAPSKAAAKRIPAKKDAAKNLEELFEDGLKDLYWAEKALTKTLPKMHKNATSAELKTAIADHLKETQNQITRLETCFTLLGKKAQAKKCAAMQGIIDEGTEIVQESMPGSVRDAGIIAASQKVEHYEIASYGTLAAFAKVLGYNDVLTHLLATLDEEKKCDSTLSAIADMRLNTTAV